MRQPGAPLALLLAASSALFLVGAAAARADGPPILHEYVPLGPLRCEGGVCRRDERAPAATANPDAIQVGGRVIEAPSAPPSPQRGEQVYQPQPAAPVVAGGGSPPVPGDPPPERRDRVRPDRDTGGELPGKHAYHEVFNPAVFPFKRMTALDSVSDDGSLFVAQPALRGMPVVGAQAREPKNDVFWGSVVIELLPDRWVPIPSSAAGVRVLSYQVEPPVRLDFARDGADSVFVRGAARGQHRLTWLEEAPASYFGGALPPGLRLADEPASLLRPVPLALRADAERVLRHIGVDRRRPLKDVLDALINYFRGFETGALPPSENTPYLDLALARKGVCRHRSYAFIITALAAGVPTRYIENELHVYVEVFVPRVGWRRVNLGGASTEEDLQNMDGKVLHQPRAADPFPMPEPYRKNHGAQGADKPGSAMLHEVYQRSRAGGDDDDDASGRGTGGTGGNGTKVPGTPGTSGTSADAPPGDDGPAAAAPVKPRARTTITLETEAHEVFRGASVPVRGRFTAEGASPAGVRVSVELVGAGGLRVPIGDVTTDKEGRFDATVPLPSTVPLGRYRIVARTDGDEQRAPARSGSGAPVSTPR